MWFPTWYLIFILAPFYLLFQLFLLPYRFFSLIKLKKIAEIYWYIPKFVFMEIEAAMMHRSKYFKSFKSRWSGYKKNGLFGLKSF